MKRETLRHPKTYDLASRLGCDRPTALGHLMLLWDWTTEVATGGNIGRWPNGAIAGSCDWRGDADQFVGALVAAGWLDQHPEHRLVIHDWGQHCENWVRSKAQKLGIELLGSDPNSKTHKSETQDADIRARHKSDSFPRDPAKPNPAKPNPVPGAGVSAKQDTGKKSVFAKLNAEHLRDNLKLESWFRFATTEADSPLFADSGRASAANLLRVFGAAERAIEKSKTPIKLFRFIVGKERWTLISTEQEERARKRLSRLHQQSAT